MSVEKIALNDEMMDSVTGGTMVPRPVEGGESLNTFVARLNAESSRHYDVAQIIKWNGLDPNSTDPAKTLENVNALKVLY